MNKIDFKKELKHLYLPTAKAVVPVDVPTLRFLMIDGEGDPNTTPQYAEAIEALFAVSYLAKFAVKRGPLATDYAVMPLEGLWWADDLSSFESNDRARWKWTLMIMQPELVGMEVLQAAVAEAKRKKDLPGLTRLRVENFTEGLCAQVLHVGPFTEEGPTIKRVHDFIQAKGRLTGKHHEIYLSDIRRAAAASWKTIIRQPMGSCDGVSPGP